MPMFSEFGSVTPGGSTVLVGVHSGANAKMTVAQVLAVAHTHTLANISDAGTAAALASDNDPTLAANSAIRLPTQAALVTYIANQIAASIAGLLDLKTGTDCSGNPNYPAASKGDAYYVTVAGKIGGASGKSVDVGDVYFASADNAGGAEGSVGTSWFVLEHNLAGALLAANNLSDLANAATARANLGLGTGDSPQFTAVNIGHASDTTVLRVSAGRISVESVELLRSTITGPTVTFTETDNGNSGTSKTIDWTSGNKQKLTLTGNCTLTFTAPAGPTNLVLRLIQDGTGSRTVTWPAAVHWSGGTAPTLTTTASKVDLVTLYYDGTTYFGCSSLNYTA